LGRHDEAVLAARVGVMIEGQVADSWLYLGAALFERASYEEAEKVFREALRLDPRSPIALLNLGRVLVKLNRLEIAEQALRGVLTLQPNSLTAHFELGRVLYRRGDLSGAEMLCRRALEIDPTSADARFTLGTIHLARRNFSDGWTLYESRLEEDRHARAQATLPHPGRPRWEGEDLAGRKILVYAEQGLGDTIQFVRYLPALERLGATVCMSVPRDLLALLRPSFPTVEFIPAETAPSCPPYDYFCPLLSLPHRLGVDLDSIRGEPYLSAPAERSHVTLEATSPDARLLVGFVWRGNERYAYDLARSAPVQLFRALAEIDGVRLVSLYKGPAQSELRDAHIVDLGARFLDFSDTAAAIDSLDVVISVDTAVAHLAGAMGKPTWILLPKVSDWRWFLEGDTTPWYESARLFRQRSVGDWAEVLERVRRELEALVAGRAQRAAVRP
jgi:tetratricopeptide (TPR) repeat protein